MTHIVVLRRSIVTFLAAILWSVCAHSADKDLHKQLLKLAEQGNAEAQYHVGMMFNNGIGTKKDPKKAFRWFQKSADLGDALAAYKVGSYYSGQFAGVVEVDAERALRYKLLSAEAGYSLAQYDVGILYYRKSDWEKVIKWWQQAADQGSTEALHNISAAYIEGKLLPKDKALAYAYYKLAHAPSGEIPDSRYQAPLGELKAALNPAESEKAERFIAEWHAKPTLLTRRAAAGVDEAKRVAGTPRE